MTCLCLEAPQAPARPRAPWRRLFELWQRRWHTRRALARLADNPQALADIGLSRDQVRAESAVPFWR